MTSLAEKIRSQNQANWSHDANQKIETFENSKAFKTCENCGQPRFWRPFRSPEWLCFDCSPPPSGGLIEEMVNHGSGQRMIKRKGKWIDVESQEGDSSIDDSPTPEEPAPLVHVVSSVRLQSPDVCICKHCQSHTYIETTYSNGVTESKCVTCKRLVEDDWPVPQPRERSMSKNYKEIFTCIKGSFPSDWASWRLDKSETD